MIIFYYICIFLYIQIFFKVLVRQEITRKVGLSLQPEEEVLTRRFEAMHSQVSAPTQFKGRISEMLSQLRMRNHIDTHNQERYAMDPIAQDDIKTVCKYITKMIKNNENKNIYNLCFLLVFNNGATWYGTTYSNNKF